MIRVFPRRTSYTPIDDYVFIGDPPLFRPPSDEVHISVAFTWDIKEGQRLKEAWAGHYGNVKIGGPAIKGNNQPKEFVPGMYLKGGVTITSRGCNSKCPWCLVPEMEGKLILLDIKPGHIIQDNDILATPRSHQENVYRMLSKQRRAAVFAGGINARRVNGWFAEQLKGMRVDSLFLAADTKDALAPLAKAVEILKFLGREKLRCYMLIGFGGEKPGEAEERLKEVWHIGCMPFAQLYQPPSQRIDYPQEWRNLARTWSRPAAMKNKMANVN